MFSIPNLTSRPLGGRENAMYRSILTSGSLLLLLNVSLVTPAGPVIGAPRQIPAAKTDAQIRADIGHNELHLGRLSEAQANCDAALKLDPANVTAKECLDEVSAMMIDQDLNTADAKLLSHDKNGAIELASKWVHAGASSAQQERAQKILNFAQARSPREIIVGSIPGWLWQLLVAVSALIVFAFLLLILRKLWRKWKRGEWYGRKKIIWGMIPLKELSASPDTETCAATDAVLDALARVGPELKRELWCPKLLLLRPTPPANYEPAVVSSFLSNSLPSLMLAPAADDLTLEWQLHDVQLDAAVQNLQLKTATGIDIGSVARFFRGLVQWFNSGAPTISGIAQTGEDKTVSIRLTAQGGRMSSVSISTSTEPAPAIDPVQLSAERAAFKFLFGMRYPGISNDEMDGFSALRQAASLFAQYANTVPGGDDDGMKRTSSLSKAATNFGFFRSSIPTQSSPCLARGKGSSLNIPDEVRQSVLLAEGVAHALLGKEQYMFAIDCFRQLEDWPGSPETASFRHQAAYNEAIVWRELGRPGQCVLQLTELLGERTTDTIAKGGAANPPMDFHRAPASDAIRYCARVARLFALAQYDEHDWETFPHARADQFIDDANKLFADLEKLRQDASIAAGDQRVIRYLYTEALRSIGHVELMRVINGPAVGLYQNGRPTLLLQKPLNQEGVNLLNAAVGWMLACEQLSPSCDLYCDLAESYLLLSRFDLAGAYGRHAVLGSSPGKERAYYLVSESFFLQNTEGSIVLAKAYAKSFEGKVTLESFHTLRAVLGISDGMKVETKIAA